MTPEEEIERFFSAYPKDWRKWVELSEEYQLAIKRGNTTAALEIAAVILSDYLNYRERKGDISRVMKKEFPDISN